MQARKRQVLARIEQARADVAAAEIYAGYFHLSAPFSGLVAARHAEPGALAAPGAALLTIEDSHNYRLEVSVEESKLLHVRQGTTAAVRIDALGGDEIGGTVSEIVPAADPASRSFLVKLQLPATPRLRSGMFGRAAFQTGAAEVMTVPRSGLVERGQLVGVFVLDSSNRASFRLIKPGRTFGDRIEVLSGLNGGERVAAERTDGLQEGVLVTPLAAR
jgi:RND family efflux transporter MFP subunit